MTDNNNTQAQQPTENELFLDEVQSFHSAANNFGGQILDLLDRVEAVQSQTTYEHLLDEASEIEGCLDYELADLASERHRLETYSNLQQLTQEVDLWRSGVVAMIDQFTTAIQELEERVGAADNQVQVYDLVSADITQQQLDKEEACSVCLEEFKPEISVKKCSACQNSFHGSCMTRWLATNSIRNCPLCRSVLRV